MNTSKLFVLSLVLSLSACGPDWITPQGPKQNVVVVLTSVPTSDPTLNSNNPDNPTDAGNVFVTTDAGNPSDAGTVSDAGSQGACNATLINATSTPPTGCVRVDGSNVGQLATYTVGTGTVTFTHWTYKTDNDCQTDGFSYTSTVDLGYAVKAGTTVFYGTTSPWSNPNGDSGPTVNGISNVTLCPCSQL